MNRVITSGNAVTSLLLVVAVMLLVGFACNSGSKPLPPEYVGVWTAADGSTLTLRADATGDYKSGGTSVTGGAVEIDDAKKEMTIKLVGIGPTFKLDKPPANGQMTLDGMNYRRAGGGSDTSSDTISAKSVIPAEDKLQTLAKTTLMDFSDAVQEGDFVDFYHKTAKAWQDQTTSDELLESFKVFVDNKQDYNFKKAIAPLEATFTPAPSIQQVAGMDALVLSGYFPTKPERANFELKYTMEDGTWKLISVHIKTNRQ
jgi:hypothetical protein